MKLLRLIVGILLLSVLSGQAEELSLYQVALRALQQHPDQNLAQAQLDGAKAGVKQTSAAFYPSFDGVVSYRPQKSLVGSSSSPVVFRGFNDYYLSAVGSQTLFDSGRRKHRSRSADLNEAAFSHLREDTVQSRLEQAAQAFFQLAFALERLRLEEQNIGLSQMRLDNALSKQEGPSCAPDQALSQADLSLAESRYLEAQNAEEIARIALAGAMGEAEPYRGALQEHRLPDNLPQADEVLDRACQLRPDLLAATARAQAAESRVKAARADYRPKLDLSAGYQVYSTDPSLNLRAWRLGLDLSFPIFKDPQLSGAVDQALAAREQAEARQRLLELRINTEVQSSFLNAQLLKRRVEQARLAADQAYNSFQLTWNQYQNGNGTCRSVSIAQRDYLDAQRNALAVELQYQLALLQKYRSSGTLSLETFQVGGPKAPTRRHP